MGYYISCQQCGELYVTDSVNYSFQEEGVLKVSFLRCFHCGSDDGVIMRGLMQDAEIAKNIINESIKLISEFNFTKQELETLTKLLKDNPGLKPEKTPSRFKPLIEKIGKITHDPFFLALLTIVATYHMNWMNNHGSKSPNPPPIDRIEYQYKGSITITSALEIQEIVQKATI